MILRPADFGAVGNGRHDDAPALNALFEAASAAEVSPDIDLSGSWYVAEPVWMRAPDESRIRAGSIRALPDALLSVVLYISLGQGCHVSGLLVVGGSKGGAAWLKNRNAVDAVHIHKAPDCVFDGFRVSHVQRWGVRNDAWPEGNTIGCRIGHIAADFCGTAGFHGAPSYTRAASKLLSVTRDETGEYPGDETGGVKDNLATLHFDPETAPALGEDDLLLVSSSDGSWLAQVLYTGASPTVWPWPGPLSGPAPAGQSWLVEALIGGAVKLRQGNTAGLSIGTLSVGYCAVGLSCASLYGVAVGSIVSDVAGLTVVVGALGAEVKGVLIGKLHAEKDLCAVVIGGRDVVNLQIDQPWPPLTDAPNSARQILPCKNTGEPIPATWPLVGLQP